MRSPILVILVYIFILIVAQVIIGQIPVSLLSFPINALFALLWILVVWYLVNNKSRNFIVKTISSNKFSITVIVTFLACLLVLGTVSQDSSKPDLFRLHSFTTSIIFIGVVFLLVTNLLCIIIRYNKSNKPNRVRFSLMHIGLLLLLSAGFIGALDQSTYRAVAQENVPQRESYNVQGEKYLLKYKIVLKSLDIKYVPNGTISKCSGNFDIDKTNVNIAVNEPYSPTFDEDIYMVSYNKDVNYCILEIVKQPWKYFMLAGLIMIAISAVMLFIKGPVKECKI